MDKVAAGWGGSKGHLQLPCSQNNDPPSKSNLKIRISARMLAPFSQEDNNNSQNQSQVKVKHHQESVMCSKMRREIKRLKNMVRKLKMEKMESDEKAKRYLAQSTLTSYGIKCLKKASGGVTPKLLKCISQQMADTFYTPVIITKRRIKSPVKSRKKPEPCPPIPSPEKVPSKPTLPEPTLPEIVDKNWGLLSFSNSSNSQLSQIS